MSNHADRFTLSELENIISSLSQVDPTNAAIRGQSSRPKVIRVWLPKTIDFSDTDQKWQLVIIYTIIRPVTYIHYAKIRWYNYLTSLSLPPAACAISFIMFWITFLVSSEFMFAPLSSFSFHPLFIKYTKYAILVPKEEAFLVHLFPLYPSACFVMCVCIRDTWFQAFHKKF